MVKNPPSMQETGVRSLGWEDPLEKGTTIQSSILAWRILAGYNSWGCEESDTTKRLTLSVFRGDLVLSLMLVGERLPCVLGVGHSSFPLVTSGTQSCFAGPTPNLCCDWYRPQLPASWLQRGGRGAEGHRSMVSPAWAFQDSCPVSHPGLPTLPTFPW